MVKPEIHPVYQRMAELTFKQKFGGGLNITERQELEQCMQWNMNRCLKACLLQNLSFAAYLVGDTDWQHEICADIDKLLEG